MKVLHFFKTYWPDSFGGMERAIHAIATSTARHGVSCEVLSLSRRPGDHTLQCDGHMAIKAKLTAEIASTGLSLEALRLFRERAALADIVHYHFPWPFMDAAHFFVRHGKPSVLSYQSDIVKQKRLMVLYRPLMRRFLKDMDAVIAASPAYARTSPVLRAHDGSIDIIEDGLDQRDYPAPDAAAIARWAACFDGPFFLFTGVLRYYKGLHVLIEAARLTRLPVVIAGDGPMGERLKRQAAGNPFVHFLGAVDEPTKIALLHACRGFVFPSHLRSEAFGLSLVEAAMAGRAAIACEIGTGTTHIVLDGATGLAVPPDDPPALAAAMRRLADDPALAVRLGHAARRRYEALFTAEHMGAAYAALYRRVLEGKAGAQAAGEPMARWRA